MKFRKMLAVAVLAAVVVTGCGVGQQSGFSGPMMDRQGRHEVSMMQGPMSRLSNRDAVRGRQWGDVDRCGMSTGVLMHRWTRCQRTQGSSTRWCRAFQR